MITKRIIPCLDIKNGRVVKGTNFQGLADVSSPIELAKAYSDNGADELVFYDITASAEGRQLFTDVLRQVASQIFIPLTVGGGINTVEDFDRVLKCGADKVSVNSGAIRNPQLIYDAAQKYGSQCVVLSADIKRVDGQFRLFAKGGREDARRAHDGARVLAVDRLFDHAHVRVRAVNDLQELPGATRKRGLEVVLGKRHVARRRVGEDLRAQLAQKAHVRGVLLLHARRGADVLHLARIPVQAHDLALEITD